MKATSETKGMSLLIASTSATILSGLIRRTLPQEG